MSYLFFHRATTPGYASFIQTRADHETLTYFLSARLKRVGGKIGISLKNGPRKPVTEEPTYSLFDLQVSRNESTFLGIYVKLFGIILSFRILRDYIKNAV